MPLNYAESVRHKLRALTGKNPGHEIGTGFLALAEDVDKYLLAIVSSSSEHTLTLGEMALMTATANLKLPSPTTSVICGAICKEGTTAILAEGGAKIFGDFLAEAGVAEVKLAKNQHVIFLADGSNWRIIAGEPKREQTYTEKTYTVAEAKAGITPSATRPATVNVSMQGEKEKIAYALLGVGGKSAGYVRCQSQAAEFPIWTVTLSTNPGEAWELEIAEHITSLYVFTKIL